MKSNTPKSVVLVFVTALLSLFSSCKDNSENTEIASANIPATVEMKAILTSPPHVPPPTGKRKAKKLIVDMEILEQEGEMTNGGKYMYWTCLLYKSPSPRDGLL